MGGQDKIHPVTVPASDLVLSLADFTLDYATKCVREAGGPLVPFVVTVINGEPTLYRFSAPNIADGVVAAKQNIATLPDEVQAYAIAYDAILHLEDYKCDAIMVEVGERGGEKAYEFAQRYKPKSFLKPFTTIGNAMYLGKIVQRLK